MRLRFNFFAWCYQKPRSIISQIQPHSPGARHDEKSRKFSTLSTSSTTPIAPDQESVYSEKVGLGVYPADKRPDIPRSFVTYIRNASAGKTETTALSSPTRQEEYIMLSNNKDFDGRPDKKPPSTLTTSGNLDATPRTFVQQHEKSALPRVPDASMTHRKSRSSTVSMLFPMPGAISAPLMSQPPHLTAYGPEGAFPSFKTVTNTQEPVSNSRQNSSTSLLENDRIDRTYDEVCHPRMFPDLQGLVRFSCDDGEREDEGLNVGDEGGGWGFLGTRERQRGRPRRRSCDM